MNTAKDKALKIAIIGAGSSGLTMAHYLQKQGFYNVTLFEKNQYPGGKVLSVVEENTGHILELGAVWVPYAYQTVRELIEEHQVELIDAPMTQLTELNPARSNQKYIRNILCNIRKSKAVQAYLQARREGKNFPFAQPGFEFDIEKDFTLSFSEYTKKYQIEPLGDAFIPLDTGCGYGFPEEVPALYKLKFLDLVLKDMDMQLASNHPKADRQTKYVKKGYQEIWKQMAKNQNIQYNAPITKISHHRDTYDNDQITLTINGHSKEDTFDRVMVSSTGDDICPILDSKSLPLEKELFQHVETYPYYVSLFKAKGLDTEKLRVSLIKENATCKKAGHPTILAAPCSERDSELFMNWTVSKHNIKDCEVEEKLALDINKLGGKYCKSLIQKKWKRYFPHVKQDSLLDINGKGGFYSQLRQLQGQKGIYYAGGLLGFETVEHTCNFGRKLVEENFA